MTLVKEINGKIVKKKIEDILDNETGEVLVTAAELECAFTPTEHFANVLLNASAEEIIYRFACLPNGPLRRNNAARILTAIGQMREEEAAKVRSACGEKVEELLALLGDVLE